MKTILITVEGATELTFAKDVLAPYFGEQKKTIFARKVKTSSDSHREYRGGVTTYQKIKNDIQRWVKERGDIDAIIYTTMFDLYALPKDFPGMNTIDSLHDPYKKVEHIEGAFKTDIDFSRFVPYIQLHEFEALVLAMPDIISPEYLDCNKEIESLKDIVLQHQNNPELVNDGIHTAPSKRIESLIQKYSKTVGAQCFQQDHIPKLKQKCRHFGAWIDQLESF
jgi:hypothetical protein